MTPAGVLQDGLTEIGRIGDAWAVACSREEVNPYIAPRNSGGSMKEGTPVANGAT